MLKTQELLSILKDTSTTMPIYAMAIIVIIGISIVAAGIFLLIYYYKVNIYKEEFAAAGEHYSKGSFKGFWHRNRSAILMFFSASFIIIGLILIGVPLLNITPNSNL